MDSQFPDYLGKISAGHGKVVLPSPSIESDWNLTVRDYEDRTFQWGLVAGLEPDPSLGYQFVEAASYRLEITPDLGWTELEAMFTPYEPGTGTGNGRLKVFRDLVVGSHLVDQGDQSVQYQVALDDMRRILAPGFERYLWRVVAVSENGHEGHPSAVQSFRGRVVVSRAAWTVNGPSGPLQGLTARLSGTRQAHVSSIEINDTDAWTSYPSPETWEAEVPLSGGRNVFFVRAFDAQGNGSEYRKVEVEVKNEALETHAYFNTFDEFGFLMGLSRLPGERNASYKARIQDVLVHRAGPKYWQIMNGLGRELDLSYIDEALRILPAIDTETGRRYANVRVWKTSSWIYVSDPRMVARHEYVELGGNTWKAELAHPHVLSEVVVEQPIGQVVPSSAYTVEDGEITFKHPTYTQRPLYVTYTYAERFKSYDRTVTALVTDLNNFTVEGKNLLSVTIDPNMTGSESASGLQTFPVTTLGSSYRTAGDLVVSHFPVRWMEVELHAFLEEDFVARFRNDHGSLFGSRYAGWAMQIKRQMHTTWGFLVADKNVWSHPRLRTSGIGSLSTHWDSFQGGWVSTVSGPVYSTRQAWPRSFRDPANQSHLRVHGVPWRHLRGGIGDGWSLRLALEDLDPTPIEGGALEAYFVQEVTTDSGVTALDTMTEVSA